MPQVTTVLILTSVLALLLSLYRRNKVKLCILYIITTLGLHNSCMFCIKMMRFFKFGKINWTICLKKELKKKGFAFGTFDYIS